VKIELTSEAKLEGMIRERIATLKAQYDCWRNPEQLCAAMGIRVEYGRIGLGREGAAFADAIQVDPTAGVPARRRFTFYHELVHHVVRNYDELYSIINDQYQTDAAFRAIQERLCNVGAAEFLLPRTAVQAAYREHGFSVDLIGLLSQPGIVSRVATFAQLAFCAPHACIGVACRKEHTLPPVGDLISDVAISSAAHTVIDVAFPSPTMKYSCASGTMVAGEHVLSQVFRENEGERLVTRAPIPFRSGTRWQVECEALRLGGQVFAFFHKDAPPTSVRNQLSLPW
jgi:uncharacterized protein DUF955